MTIIELISALGGFAGIGTLLWYAINLRSKKKIEKATADGAAAEADGKVADNWQRFAEKIQGEYDSLSERFHKMEQRQLLVERALSTTAAQKNYAEYHICTDLGCQDRKPPIGTFHTEDHTDIIKAAIDEDKNLDR